MKGNYKIVEWMMNEMSPMKREIFFSTPNKLGKDPIESVIMSKSAASKKMLKTLQILVSNVTSKYEKKFEQIFVSLATISFIYPLYL